MESISTAVVSGIQRHAQCAHVETEAAQQHQTRLQKLCDNFWSRVWFCCSRVRTNQKKVVKTTFQFQAIFPNQTLHQKDVTESAPLRSRRGQYSDLQMVLWDSAPTPGSLRLASALPTSAWVTPSLMRRCLNRSAKASEHSVILSYIGSWQSEGGQYLSEIFLSC